MPEKKRLVAADIEVQAGLELPDRETMALVNTMLVEVLSNNKVAV
jgi:hypothetical protein